MGNSSMAFLMLEILSFDEIFTGNPWHCDFKNECRKMWFCPKNAINNGG